MRPVDHSDVLILHDDESAELARTVGEQLDCTVRGISAGRAPAARTTVAIASAGVEPPAGRRTHFIITGTPDRLLDAWDRELDPDLVGSCLSLGSASDPDREAAVLSWVTSKAQGPAMPLTALLDDGGRAMRWTTISARCWQADLTGPTPPATAPSLSSDDIRDLVDAQPAAQSLGRTVERLAPDGADATLERHREFLAAVADMHHVDAGLDQAITERVGPIPDPEPKPADPDLSGVESALAGYLREVQRTGLGRWTGGRRRAEAADALRTAAMTAAGQRLTATLERAERMAAAAATSAEERASADATASRRQELVDDLADQVRSAAAQATPWTPVATTTVSRPWGGGAPRVRCWATAPDTLQEDLAARLAGDGIEVLVDRAPTARVVLVAVMGGLPCTALFTPSQS